jgi:2-amino-4-hydroxy-6-hydroxymethyldihydropteridine diphosphokinase
LQHILLGLGSNKGNRTQYLQAAIHKINNQLGKVISKASLYETAAWGKTDQASFLNTCIIVKTVYSPKMCFKIIKQIEKQLERKSTEHWGPREIDIDILLYDQDMVESKELTIPHAQMHARNFVLVPSAQIAPNWIHPIFKLTLKELAKRSEDPLKVDLWRS